MFDVGWTELLVIGALALIVVGPRDLPQLMRTVGQAVGKIKRMAREFQRSMDDAAREADLTEFKELRNLKKEMGGLDFRQQASKARSYLNQPLKSETSGTKVAGATATGAAAAESGATAESGAGSATESGSASAANPASAPETPAASEKPDSGRSAPGTGENGASADGAPESAPVRQAGVKG